MVFHHAQVSDVEIRCKHQGRKIPGPIADDDGAHLGHALRKLRQGLVEGGLFKAVAENAGLALVEPPVLLHRRGIVGPDLAQGRVQKAASALGPGLQNGEILRAEEHAGKQPIQGRAGALLYLAHEDPPGAPVRKELE